MRRRKMGRGQRRNRRNRRVEAQMHFREWRRSMLQFPDPATSEPSLLHWLGVRIDR